MYRQAAGDPIGPRIAPLRSVDLDVTVLALPQHLPLLRQTATSFASRHGVPRPDDVRLAVSEACMNAVRHAYPEGDPGPLRLHGTCAGGFVTFTVEDRGVGLRPHPLARGLGVGLPIVAQVADHYAVEGARDGGGTRVRMSFATGPEVTR